MLARFRRLLLAALPLAALLGPNVALARPKPPPTATVRVAEGYEPVTSRTGPYTYRSEDCQVTLHRRGATSAYDVLVTATTKRCVSSFEADETPNGHYLRCVEGRCESTGFYWAIYENGALTCAGLDDVVVREGDEVTFSYESYPTALALATCPM